MYPMHTTVRQIANAIQVLNGANDTSYVLAHRMWKGRVETIEGLVLPFGSGMDNGCEIDIENSKPDSIIIDSGFHCMNDDGYYCGWVHARFTFKPSFLYGIVAECEVTSDSTDDRDRQESACEEMQTRIIHALNSEISWNRDGSPILVNR